jgi:hypothetical protein
LPNFRLKTGFLVKGIGSPDEYFLEGQQQIKSILSVHMKIVFKFLACIVQEKNTFKAPLKTLINSKDIDYYIFRNLFAICIPNDAQPANSVLGYFKV